MKLVFGTFILFVLVASTTATIPGSVGKCQYDCTKDSDCQAGLICADDHKAELKKRGYDERKADCTSSLGAWDDEVCFDPKILQSSGGGGGDPHFRTYDGTKYDYHGQCDLVMARSPEFDSGLGLHLHARTEIVNGWSLISNAVLNIGQDIFELVNDNKYYLNGEEVMNLPIFLAGKYEVTKSIRILGGTHEQLVINVKIDESQNIEFTNFLGMVSVQVNVELPGTVGMLGMQTKLGMIGRDGETVITDANQMGSEWQVTDQEPQLFREEHKPQYPEACILPSIESRRLQQFTEEQQKAASEACRGVDLKSYEFCVHDVLLTGNGNLAHAYGYAF